MTDQPTDETEAPTLFSRWMKASAPSSVVGWPVVSEEGQLICNLPYFPPGFPDREKLMEIVSRRGDCIAAAPLMMKAIQAFFAAGTHAEHDAARAKMKAAVTLAAGEAP